MTALFEKQPLAIPGCFEIRPRRLDDARGYFVKTFERVAFEEMGLPTAYAEEFRSVSHRGVVRGLHFQLPPHHHHKLVYSVHGSVQDVLVDLRVGSPMFGRSIDLRIDADAANMVFMPAGIAHGFCALSNEAVMVYKVGSAHVPSHDVGILWSSVEAPWAAREPLLSQRDRQHPPLDAFKSPFVFEPMP